MEKQKEKIAHFSKIIYVLLEISYITLIVVGVLYISAWLFSVANLNTAIVTIGGMEREVPILFKLGDLKVYLPIVWESGFNFSIQQDYMPLIMQGLNKSVGFNDLLYIISRIIGISFQKSVFKLLRDNGSPFREDVVKALKKLAIAMLILGAVSGNIPILAAGIVWVLCLVCEYGRLLQNESDTTL